MGSTRLHRRRVGGSPRRAPDRGCPLVTETLFTGQPGPKGDKGERGEGISRGARLAVIFLFVVALALSAANAVFTAHYVNTTQAGFKHQQAAQQAIQRHAGLLIEQKLCQDVGTMSRIVPPAGSASANPSRAYEQAEHQAWAGLYADIGCKELKP